MTYLAGHHRAPWNCGTAFKARSRGPDADTGVQYLELNSTGWPLLHLPDLRLCGWDLLQVSFARCPPGKQPTGAAELASVTARAMVDNNCH